MGRREGTSSRLKSASSQEKSIPSGHVESLLDPVCVMPWLLKSVVDITDSEPS